MKRNLYYLSNILDENMITEDSLGNINTEHNYEGGFSDQEEINEMKKCSAIAGAITKELEMMKEVIRQQESVDKYGIAYSKSGKAWENTPYWSSRDGDVLIEDLGDNHLARIPRHLYNNGVVSHKDDLPPNIVKEINKRGFKLLDNCVVIQ